MTTAFDFDPLSQPAPQLLTGPDVVTRGTGAAWATFSVDELYRYVLGRRWDLEGALLVVCMLNPSTATDEVLDPTLRRVQGFAQREHMGGFLVVNCFAYRATDRHFLRIVQDPIGPRNDEAVVAAIERPMLALSVAAWGRPDTKKIEQRMRQVRCTLSTRRSWWTFGDLTAGGFPRHPLYLRGDTPIVKWTVR